MNLECNTGRENSAVNVYSGVSTLLASTSPAAFADCLDALAAGRPIPMGSPGTLAWWPEGTNAFFSGGYRAALVDPAPVVPQPAPAFEPEPAPRRGRGLRMIDLD